MDQVKINTPLMRGIVSKLIKNSLKKKFNFKELDIDIESVQITNDETGLKARLIVNAHMDEAGITDLLTKAGW